jgi:hypothetical protein
MVDLSAHISLKRDDLLREAERERLAAQVPHSPSAVRRELAQAIYRLAGLIDAEAVQYLPPSEAGPTDWVAGSAGV